MKKMKIYTKLIIVFLIFDALMLSVIWMGYSTAHTIANLEDPTRYLHNYNIFSGVILIVTILIMVLSSIGFSRDMRKGFGKLTDIAMKLADGEIDIEIEEHGKDEFGILLDDFEQLIEASKEQARIANSVAEGDLTIEVKPRSEKDLLGIALKKMVDRNNNSLSNINESAYQVMTSSSQVASASEALAQGSTEQASAIEEITSSISEIAEKTKQNAEQATEAADLVSVAIENVKQENVQMKDMMSAMQDINHSSESISKIIKVIDDIAFQTNILALNAAVEAARAGEAGKGFAVVAEEVRNLAAKSAAAASETAELIEDSISKVEVGSRIANDTAVALETITDGVSRSAILIKEIAESSNYQATAVAQINQAISQVSQVVQTNSATSQQCAAASEELSNQSVHMREMLSIYHLENEAVSASTYSYTPRKESSYTGDSTAYDMSTNPNERIISLGEGFGKY